MSWLICVTCSKDNPNVVSLISAYYVSPSSEFVSSSIPSRQILTAHAQPFRGARDLAFCLKVHLDSLLVWASSKGSGETARMRRLAWTFAARICDKYQIRLTRSNCSFGRVERTHHWLGTMLQFWLAWCSVAHDTRLIFRALPLIILATCSLLLLGTTYL